MDAEKCFDNRADAVVLALERYVCNIGHMKKEINGRGAKVFPTDLLNEINKNLTTMLDLANHGFSMYETLLLCLPPSIKWVPEEKVITDMSWETGITPWSFWLKYSDRLSEIKELCKNIKTKWLNKELESVQFPEEGMSVIICSKKRIYRGIIISIGSKPKLLVINVDDGKEREEDFDCCFKATKDFFNIHANVIHCSLGKDNFRGAWETQYSQDFVSLLQYSKLTVKILDEVTDNGLPTFVVEMIAYNEDDETEVNVCEWLSEKCGNLSEQPYFRNPPKNNMENHNLEANRFLKIVKFVENDKIGSKKGDTSPISEKSPFKFESVVDVPEYIPVERHPTASKGSTNGMNGYLEMPVLPGGYLPKDDERTCSIYLKEGSCQKKGCRKEHSQSDKWTNDKEGIYCNTFNEVVLPDVGSVLTVTVTHICASNAFYVHLPQLYSGSPDGETLEDLILGMNSPKNLKEMTLLSSPPCYGEFIIAFSKVKQKWLRGSVCDVVNDTDVEVFFVDYGITEEIRLDQCRKLLPEFNHFPSQAVYTTLADVMPVSDSRISKTGKQFLESQILNKTIEVSIAERCPDDNLLEVFAFLEDINFNELMIKEGYGTRLLKK